MTICCKDQAHLFGKIREGEMVLNEVGKIAEECWMQIPEHFPEVSLHEFVLMPNHMHGIIEITVGAENFLPLQPSTNKFQKMIPRSVSSVVKGFKIGVTKEIRKIMPDVQVWQRKYYEQIIRNSVRANCTCLAEGGIRPYESIRNNPVQWQEDEYYK